MIFLTVGSWYRGFDRLVKAVEELHQEGTICEEVVAQIGPGAYKPTNIQAMEFCSPKQFQQFMADARIIIAHAGMGTIAEAVSRGKPIVVVPRKHALGEHLDDHQFATARQLEAEGKIIVAYDTKELSSKLQEAEGFVPTRTEGSRDILKTIDAFICDLAANRQSTP